MVARDALSPRQVFAGDFRVVRCMSRGALGEVYEVEQLSTARSLALKVVRLPLALDDRATNRFSLDARMSAEIDSPHVVSVLNAGVDAATGLPWLVMELLDGHDLAHTIDTQGAIPLATAREVLRQVCHAVGTSHHVGLAHGDLKPENVFLTHGEPASSASSAGVRVKVLSYGIARWTDGVRAAANLESLLGGSWLWAAPERASAGQVNPAGDVWSLGLLVFRMLTGRAFWRTPEGASEGDTALQREVRLDEIPRASLRAAELGRASLLPPEFDTWFAQCVHRDPAQRFPNADTLLTHFERMLTAPRKRSPRGVFLGLGAVALVAGTALTLRATVFRPASTASHAQSPIARTVPLDVPIVPIARTVPLDVPSPDVTLALPVLTTPDVPVLAASDNDVLSLDVPVALATAPDDVLAPDDASTTLALAPDVAPLDTTEPAQPVLALNPRTRTPLIPPPITRVRPRTQPNNPPESSGRSTCGALSSGRIVNGEQCVSDFGGVCQAPRRRYCRSGIISIARTKVPRTRDPNAASNPNAIGPRRLVYICRLDDRVRGVPRYRAENANGLPFYGFILGNELECLCGCPMPR